MFNQLELLSESCPCPVSAGSVELDHPGSGQWKQDYDAKFPPPKEGLSDFPDRCVICRRQHLHVLIWNLRASLYGPTTAVRQDEKWGGDPRKYARDFFRCLGRCDGLFEMVCSTLSLPYAQTSDQLWNGLVGDLMGTDEHPKVFCFPHLKQSETASVRIFVEQLIYKMDSACNWPQKSLASLCQDKRVSQSLLRFMQLSGNTIHSASSTKRRKTLAQVRTTAAATEKKEAEIAVSLWLPAPRPTSPAPLPLPLARVCSL